MKKSSKLTFALILVSGCASRNDTRMPASAHDGIEVGTKETAPSNQQKLLSEIEGTWRKCVLLGEWEGAQMSEMLEYVIDTKAMTMKATKVKFKGPGCKKENMVDVGSSTEKLKLLPTTKQVLLNHGVLETIDVLQFQDDSGTTLLGTVDNHDGKTRLFYHWRDKDDTDVNVDSSDYDMIKVTSASEATTKTKAAAKTPKKPKPAQIRTW